jgi:hypothetical protein
MRIRSIAVALAALGFSLAAAADDRLARFEGGIGVIPTGSANTPVRGVLAAGQIWVISRLSADIRTDGSISVDGRGLLLGAGNSVGFNANARVFATLICEPAAPFTQHNTNLAGAAPGVALEPNGDFRINDVLTTVPADCPSPVLLIRNVANGGWFAAGIPKQ